MCENIHNSPKYNQILKNIQQMENRNNVTCFVSLSLSFYWVQLLNHHVVTELMLRVVLMNNMMERISDPCCTVRMLSVRGLGNIAVGSPEKVHTHTHARAHTLCYHVQTSCQNICVGSFHLFLFLTLTCFSHQVNKYAKELLAAMSSGMEEKDDPGKLKAYFLCWKKY